MDLKQAQQLLNITADGKWGPQSFRAVAQGLRDADLRPQLFALQLTQHFSLQELIQSSSQMRSWAIKNLPTASVLKALVYLCETILEPVRARFGQVRVTSGYRSWTPDSQHGKGEAVDYEVPGIANLLVCQWVLANLRFDQLIREGYAGGKANDGWIHTSARPDRARKSVLRTPTGRAPYMSGLGK